MTFLEPVLVGRRLLNLTACQPGTNTIAGCARRALNNDRRLYSPLPVRPHKGLRSSRVARRGSQNVKSPRLPNNPSLLQPPPSTLSPRFRDPVGQSQASFPWTEYDNITRQPSAARRSPSPSSVVVQVPPDRQGVLQRDHPAAELLSQSALVVVRQLEMLNLFVGFEQANRYRLLSPTGETVGFLAEAEQGLGGTLVRQLAGTHRAFRASVLDVEGREVLRIRRPFSIINSRIFVEDALEEPGAIVGESQQEFHLWRRRYNLFKCSSASAEGQDEPEFEQFARIDAGFLAWDFYTQDREGRLSGSVSRNFTGFGREIFTDTGQYVLRFDAVETQLEGPENDLGSSRTAQLEQGQTIPSTKVHRGGLTLDQRAVMLATAVSIDFDYFSRTSRGGLMPPIFFGGGGSDE